MNYDPAIWQARVMSHSYLWSVFPEVKETDKYVYVLKKHILSTFGRTHELKANTHALNTINVFHMVLFSWRKMSFSMQSESSNLQNGGHEDRQTRQNKHHYSCDSLLPAWETIIKTSNWFKTHITSQKLTYHIHFRYSVILRLLALHLLERYKTTRQW